MPLSSLGRVGQRAGPGSSPLGREGGHQPDFYGGGRAGPPASEPYARGGPAHETFRPEPPSVDGKYGSDWLDGSDSPWDEGPIERSAAPMRAAPAPTPVTRVGPIDRSPWPRTLLERDAGPCPRCFSPTVVRASGRTGGGSLLSSLPGQLRDHGGVQSCPRCTWVGGAVGPPCPSVAATGAPAPVKRPPPSQPAARAAPKLRRGQDVAEETLARAERLGLTGPLGSPEDYAVTGVAPPERNSLAASLETSLRLRMATSLDLPRLNTALTWWESFQIANEGTLVFKPALSTASSSGQLHNRKVIDLFGEYIRRSEPLGKTSHGVVQAAAIASYQSVILIFRSKEARYDIAPADTNIVMPGALKAMRGQDPPTGERRRSVGLRAMDLRKAAEAGFDRTSVGGAVEWAGMLFSHSALLRGGEEGVADGVRPDPTRIITWDKVVFKAAIQESHSRPWLIGLVVPIKDASNTRRAYPIAVPRRHDGPFLSDPLDPYDAMALAWWLRARVGASPLNFPCDEAGRPAPGWQLQAPAPDPSAAFFADPGGAPFTTSRVRARNKRIAALAGLDPADVGGKAGRIGGSTDYRERLGAAGIALIKQRGRWNSDVGEIYQRPLVGDHLDAAADVGNACGDDLERICAEFAQAAHY